MWSILLPSVHWLCIILSSSRVFPATIGFFQHGGAHSESMGITPWVRVVLSPISLLETRN